MIPSHSSFYDVFSKAKKIKIQWPNGARLAVTLAANLEAWTETPDPNKEDPPRGRIESHYGRGGKVQV